MTRASGRLTEADHIHSLFDTALAFVKARDSDDIEVVKRVERERWRHVEIMLSSEPSSEPGFFRVASDPILIDDHENEQCCMMDPNTNTGACSGTINTQLEDMMMSEENHVYDATLVNNTI